eukprot:TRINITY_DN2895_c1_g1_i1.p3 TRINITY_DN2895_c1_g1~~TRINITY_DN2895_c1_g1_i1.p3  ORF type:complete len:292 (-),score=72.14 TRINITY_DN2895_c1_g1_i1:1126-1974(-)
MLEDLLGGAPAAATAAAAAAAPTSDVVLQSTPVVAGDPLGAGEQAAERPQEGEQVREFTTRELAMLNETGNFVYTYKEDAAFAAEHPMVFVACKKGETARRMFFRDVTGQAIRINSTPPRVPFINGSHVDETGLAMELERLFNGGKIGPNSVIRIVWNYSQPILYIGSYLMNYWAKQLYPGVALPVLRPGPYYFDISRESDLLDLGTESSTSERIVGTLTMKDSIVIDSDTCNTILQVQLLELHFRLNPNTDYDLIREKGEHYGSWGLHKTLKVVYGPVKKT